MTRSVACEDVIDMASFPPRLHVKNSAALGTTGISIDGALLSRCGEPKSGVDSVVVVVFFYPAFRVWIDDIILYSVFFFF